MRKRLITAADIRRASLSGKKSLSFPSDACIITPMARDEAEALDVQLSDRPRAASAHCNDAACPPPMDADELIRTVSAQIQTRGTPGVPADELEKVVREVISAKLGVTVKRQALPDAERADKGTRGIRFVKAERLSAEQDGLRPLPAKMFVTNAIGDEAGTKLTGGYMTWESATFSRCLDAPEIAVVIDGELHLAINGKTMVGKPGDMIYFPEGVNVDYHAPAKVRLACVNCA